MKTFCVHAYSETDLQRRIEMLHASVEAMGGRVVSVERRRSHDGADASVICRLP